MTVSLSVLAIIKAVCEEQGITPVPTTAVSATDVNTKQLVGLLKATGRDLLQSKCWSQLKRTHSFTTTAGIENYDLPPDFYSKLFNTDWNTTQKWKLIGPTTDSRFDDLTYGYGLYTNQSYFRIFGRLTEKQFQLIPSPPDDQEIKFDYISDYWIYDTILGVPQWTSDIVTNDAITAFDSDLMILGIQWRLLRFKGLDYADIQAEYNSKINAAKARFEGDRKVRLGGETNDFLGINVPEGNFGV